MIAASDPQEFIPKGRQQVAKNPGCHELIGSKHLDDEVLLDKFEKVSLDAKQSEWWILRKVVNRVGDVVSDNFEDNKKENSRNSDIGLNGKKLYDSPNIKSFDTFQQHYKQMPNLSSTKIFGQRLSGCSETSKTNISQETEPSLKESTFEIKSQIGYMEDELYVKGNTVVWSRGLVNNFDNIDNARKTICSYTSPIPIKTAIWCNFYLERPNYDISLQLNNKTDKLSSTLTPSICVVDTHNIRVFTDKGEDFVIALPFHILGVWSTKYGIFIEKGKEVYEKNNFYASKGTLFSLSYPLDEICPVAVNQNYQQVFSNPNAKVVFTHDNPSICLIYDSNSKLHSIYKIKRCGYVERAEYAEKIDGQATSSASMCSRLKHRLSMWENVMNNSSSPSHNQSASRPPSVSSFCNVMSSKSHSSNMAAISRCQSPAVSSSNSSMWMAREARLNSSIIGESSSVPNASFFNCSKYMSHLRTNPAICLDHLWTESCLKQENSSSMPASKAFLCDDFARQCYFCYVMDYKYQLCIMQIDYSNSDNIIFGMSTTVGARDAVPIPHLHMLAILEYNGNVTLYSGLICVGKLHISGTLTQHTPSPYIRRKLPQFRSPFPRRSSLLPHSTPSDPQFDEHLLSPVLPNGSSSVRNNIDLNLPIGEGPDPQRSTLIGLRDALGNRLTLQYSDETYYRITLPSMCTSPLTEYCLNALRQCLPRDAVLTFLSRWYSTRNALGTQDVGSAQEWQMFVSLMYELLGYEEQTCESAKDCPQTPSYAAKRAKRSSVGKNEDWIWLINTEQHTLVSHSISNILKFDFTSDKSSDLIVNNVQVKDNNVLFPHICMVHFALHLMYEDLKLNTLNWDLLKPLAIFLHRVASDLGLEQYSLHYWKDFPENCTLINVNRIPVNIPKSVDSWSDIIENPPSIMQHINDLICGNLPQPYPTLKNVNDLSKHIVQLCGILCNKTLAVSNESLEKLVKPLDSASDCIIDEVPTEEPHVDMPGTRAEQVVILMTKMNITTALLNTLPYGIYLLFYSVLWKCRENPPSDWSSEAYLLIQRDDLAMQALKVKKEASESRLEKYGMYSKSQLQEITPNIKQCDLEPDGMEDIENPLMKLRFPDDIRVSEVRKMLQSSKPVPISLVQRPDVSDHDFIEEQEKHLFAICGRTMALPVGRGMFTLRTLTPVITEPLPSPQLCLTGKAAPRGTTVELGHIDTPANMNTWPLFHNGVANGLRITPDAHNIDNTWIIFNKPKGVEKLMEHGGFLLALGLNGHLKNLDVLSTFDYLSKLHEMTSVGILVGLSAAFRGTCHAGFTKTLSIHVEALLPPTSMELDIPQNLQVAALLGLGLLYEGTAHRRMTEVLLFEIGRPPGPEMENSVDRESYSLAAGLALGLVTLKQGGKPSGLSDLNVPDTLHYYMVGGNKRILVGAQRDKYKTPSFQIREGASVNLDVTAPGATLALGLMYLGSGNKAIADWMSPPETQYLLDFIRPDFLLLRILSKALILWDDIEPSKNWIEKQVPSTIKPYCMVQPSLLLDLDYEAMNQAYCNIVTGACFAIGLKYAGTANQDAFKTLLHFCHMFTSLTGKSIAELAGKPTIETCLNVVLLSASMVMAGTGNLEIIRFVRHLRRRVGVSTCAVVTYGSHLAIHMALGLLFLGGGRYTLSNSPSSIAALICAFYPKFPTHSNDNRYHLQAFRHLYVLAAEPRLLIPKDVNLMKSCYANLKIVSIDGRSFSIKGPGIIPDLTTLKEVAVDDERYWPVMFERGRNWEILKKILSTTGYIEVKQRAGCLSYIADKFGYHSQLARTLTQSETSPWNPSPSSIVSFTSDQAIKFFCDNFLSRITSDHFVPESKLVQLLTKVTYDAVVKDKLIIIPAITAFVRMIWDLEKHPNSLNLWQFKIALSQTQANFSQILNLETMLALRQRLSSKLDSWESSLQSALQAFIFGHTLQFDSNIVSKLAIYVIFYNIPCKIDTTINNFVNALMKLKGAYSEETVRKILEIVELDSK